MPLHQHGQLIEDPSEPEQVAQGLAQAGAEFGEKFLEYAARAEVDDDKMFMFIGASSGSPREHGVGQVAIVGAAVFRFIDQNDDELETFIEKLREVVAEEQQYA